MISTSQQAIRWFYVIKLALSSDVACGTASVHKKGKSKRDVVKVVENRVREMDKGLNKVKANESNLYRLAKLELWQKSFSHFVIKCNINAMYYTPHNINFSQWMYPHNKGTVLLIQKENQGEKVAALRA